MRLGHVHGNNGVIIRPAKDIRTINQNIGSQRESRLYKVLCFILCHTTAAVSKNFHSLNDSMPAVRDEPTYCPATKQ
jgi:hypothetical protein